MLGSYKVKPLVTPQKSFFFFFFFFFVCISYVMFLFFEIHPTTVMSAADSVARHGGFEARFAIAVK